MIILFLLASIASYSQVTWSDTLISYSSQISEKKFSAVQVLGEPNSMPQATKLPTSWMPKPEDKKPYITVGFSTKVNCKTIIIIQNYLPGSIYSITISNDSIDRTYLVKDYQKSNKTLQYELDSTLVVEKIRINFIGNDNSEHSCIDAVGVNTKSDLLDISPNIGNNIKFDHLIENLGPQINTKSIESYPIISPNGKVLYFCRRSEELNSREDIYQTELSLKGNQWLPAIKLAPPINNSEPNYVGAVRSDGRRIYVGNSKSNKIGYSDFINGKWRQPIPIQIDGYDPEGLFGEFNISTDEKIIVYSSEKSDGYGGNDIYFVMKNDEGKWGQPINMGPDVNTAGGEYYPFIASDNKTLFFSSDGWSGFGSTDIFTSTRLDDSWTKWSKPINLGPPINTTGSELGFSTPANGSYGYFASARTVFGQEDIFRIKLPELLKPKPVIVISGKVLRKDIKAPLKSEVVFFDMKTGKKYTSTLSDAYTGRYNTILPFGTRYGFRATSDGYLSEDQQIDLRELNAFSGLEKDLYLNPIRNNSNYFIKNLLFGKDEYEIEEDFNLELDYLAEVLIQNPSYNIVVIGHTDESGTDEYNMRLSLKRATSVKEYLVERDISDSRITVKGVGDSYSKKELKSKYEKRRVEIQFVE